MEAFGGFNITQNPPYGQWTSFNTSQNYAIQPYYGLRVSSPTIPPGKYKWLISFDLNYDCGGVSGVPCNSSITAPASYICPQANVYVSCVNSSLGQNPVQPNNCALGQTPPAGFATCQPVLNDGVNLLLLTYYAGYSEQGATSIPQLRFLTNGVFGTSPPYQVDFSYMANNCSIIVNFADPCNHIVPYVAAAQLDLAFMTPSLETVYILNA